MSKVIGFRYTLKDATTGEQLDSNVDDAVLEFVSEKGQIITGLESKLVKMKEGESAEVVVEPKDAYGEYSEEAIQKLPREQFAGIELVSGMTLYGSGEHGETVQVIVKEFNDAEVTIDYNHPMAGKTLAFFVTIESLRDATEEEAQTGFVGGVPQGGCCGGHSKDGGCCGGHDEDGDGCCGGKESKKDGGCGCGC